MTAGETPSAAPHGLAPRLATRLAVVLVAPEIPPNTGNVIRLTANAACDLHLVEPLGFRMDDRDLKRAGLDYHEYANVRVHRDWTACRAHLLENGHARFFALTTRATRSVYAAHFTAGDVLVFGCETAGLPDAVLDTFADQARLFIPMRPGVRSLNLSNAVAVTVYEAWRQLGFALPANDGGRAPQSGADAPRG